MQTDLQRLADGYVRTTPATSKATEKRCKAAIEHYAGQHGFQVAGWFTDHGLREVDPISLAETRGEQAAMEITGLIAQCQHSPVVTLLVVDAREDEVADAPAVKVYAFHHHAEDGN